MLTRDSSILKPHFLSASRAKRLAALGRAQTALRRRLPRMQGLAKATQEKFVYSWSDIAPPEQLCCLGGAEKAMNRALVIGLGGTVSPSPEGFALAELLASAVFRLMPEGQAAVVSGGAIGIDVAAHLGALDANGFTIAVVAGPPLDGLNTAMPLTSHLAQAILGREGAIVSEFPHPATRPALAFAARNRLISGLSDAFIAVECKRNSGTVDTAKRARLQGRVVLAIDWSSLKRLKHRPASGGCDQLLAERIASPMRLRTLDAKSVDEIAEVLSACVLVNHQRLTPA